MPVRVHAGTGAGAGLVLVLALLPVVWMLVLDCCGVCFAAAADDDHHPDAEAGGW